MPVRVTALGSTPDGPLGIRAVPAGGSVPAGVPLTVGAGSRFAETSMAIDRLGPWEIVLDDGVTQARIPLLVTAPAVPGWVWAVRGGLAGAVLGLVAVALLVRRRPRLAAAGGEWPSSVSPSR